MKLSVGCISHFDQTEDVAYVSRLVGTNYVNPYPHEHHNKRITVLGFDFLYARLLKRYAKTEAKYISTDLPINAPIWSTSSKSLLCLKRLPPPHPHPIRTEPPIQFLKRPLTTLSLLHHPFLRSQHAI
jgi:hypothetical protein